jgi:hypothetical protein
MSYPAESKVITKVLKCQREAVSKWLGVRTTPAITGFEDTKEEDC